MQIVTTPAAVQEALRGHGDAVGFVPTMGFLHEGHLSLVRRCRTENPITVVSVFVNPRQFGPQEDLGAYPRDMDRDQALLETAGTDILFAPTVEAMYPPDSSTTVEESLLSTGMCGASRPGHFRGVCTVVLKLFNIVRPRRAYFGEKDYQQLQVVRRMVRDLNVAVEVVGCPLVREVDGLAMSSRNAYLSSDERLHALGLSRALRYARELVSRGERSAIALKSAVERFLQQDSALDIDYIAIKNPTTLEDLTSLEQTTLVALAVRVGKTRLIDNVVLEV